MAKKKNPAIYQPKHQESWDAEDLEVYQRAQDRVFFQNGCLKKKDVALIDAITAKPKIGF